jgi:SAM-dependent methyltransferase
MIESKQDPLPVRPGEDGLTYWDKVARSKWGNYLTDVEKRVVGQGVKLAGKPSVGVDLGCGSGRWSKLASDAGWRMTCLDVEERTLSICQRNVPNANCLLADPGASTIPCPSNSAGLMLCVEVGPVVEADWFHAEASRVLHDGGILVGVVWNRRSWRGAACRLKYRLTKNPDGRKFYNHAYPPWKKKLTAAGFDVLHEEGLCWGPAGRASNSLLVPLYVKLERFLRLNRLVAWSPWVAFIARKTPNPPF